MSIKCFHSCKQLAVVAAGYEDLGMGAHGGLEDREGARGHLMLFQLCDFILAIMPDC